MLIDLLIVGLAVSALYRGKQIGFVRQACSTGGFFIGLFLGAWLEPHTVSLVSGQTAKGLITLMTTLGLALVLLTVGEYAGFHLKHRVIPKRLNGFDNGLGSVLGVATLIFSVWLLAAVSISLPFNGLQSAVDSSRIIARLNRVLPNAPNVIADLGQLIDPNGFPKVFTGREPQPRTTANLPSLGELETAVKQDRDSIVKIIGQGCGGIVDGSGFVVRPDLVATNAHVVAGIKNPHVQDDNGTHKATVVWFDPNLDFAILRVNDLAGRSLKLSTATASPGTPVAILGYPGGGVFVAKPGAVLDQFIASGRNIYGKASASRQVYEVQADIIPGNSGGPMVSKDGSVVGVIFAESTTYDQVGYALTAASISDAIAQAESRNRVTGTGQCAE
ncbi:MAG: serine protease [Candidatus Saccharibacteria bacterium]|nr:serine protease [Candidatus Saccharibacteria bacterium]